MDFDGSISEQDFDYLDGDEDSDIGDIDEDLLLRDHDEVETKQNSQNRQGSIGGNMKDGSFSHYVDYSDVPRSFVEEEEDDEISLHPDDSLFDEEDEFSTNSNRLVRPRLVFISTCFIFSTVPALFQVIHQVDLNDNYSRTSIKRPPSGL